MALDTLMIKAVTEELNKSLPGARIEKIRQPDRELLIFGVRTSLGNKKLLISTNAGNSRIHYTEAATENPSQPPMFCMLLRKYLTGARINSVTQPDMERMVVLSISSINELGDDADFRLIVELMGKNSNVILVNASNHIVDCLRRTDYGGNNERILNPGMLYRMPPKPEKPSFFLCTESEFDNCLNGINRYSDTFDWLKSSFSGLSPAMCRSLSLVDNDFSALKEYRRNALKGFFSPELLHYADGEVCCSCLNMSWKQKSQSRETFPDFSTLLDNFYSEKDADEHRKRISHSLQRTVKNNIDRLKRKLSLQLTETATAQELEKLRRTAELITVNIYRMKRGDRMLVCDDYYSEEGLQISIPLDPLKTPQQNAASAYKIYSKKKTASDILEKMITDERKELDYLNSIADSLTRAEGEKDISEIAEELTRSGYLKKKTREKSKAVKQSAPLSYLTSDGYTVVVGRNNLQNDRLTLKDSRRTDLWFHVKSFHGSHVVLSCSDTDPSETAITDAARLAAYHSEARNSGKVAVDYTMIRNVRKPSGAYPGSVVYVDYKTVVVPSDDIASLSLI